MLLLFLTVHIKLQNEMFCCVTDVLVSMPTFGRVFPLQLAHLLNEFKQFVLAFGKVAQYLVGFIDKDMVGTRHNQGTLS